MKNTQKQSPPDAESQRKTPIKAAEPIDPALTQSLTVVGIGASAGGLTALQDFFEVLPNDTGLAFVVVTHLAPEHESHMAEILQNRTGMRVRQVNGKTAVEPDNVYVIPPDREIFIADSHLDLDSFAERRGLRTPIDHFFRSLAQVHHGAIAIILSGGGTDGAVGIKSIKEEGGLLMVQHPDEAEYDSMPRAAISTGIVDVVLPVRELASTLVQYTQRSTTLPLDPDELNPQQRETLERILAHVEARTGHDFRQYKRATILRRVQRRMQLSGHETLEGYLGYMRLSATEAVSMFNDILIGVTNFFRDPKAWDALARKVIPSLFESKKANDQIRAWTIGCSTGEEAYTLGILLLEHAAAIDKKIEIQIFASDLDDASLTLAREGIYPAAIEADVSPERLEQFFTREGDYYRIKRDLRNAVLRQQILINVGQVRIRKDRVRFEKLAVVEDNAARLHRIHCNLLDGRIEHEFHARLARHVRQGLDDAVHAALRIPDSMRQLRVRHEREGGWRIERTEAHVHILEREGRLEARVIEIG